MTSVTKTQKLIRALSSGENVSIKLLEHRSGLANLRATVDRLRNQGREIYWNQRVVRGVKKNYYRMAS